MQSSDLVDKISLKNLVKLGENDLVLRYGRLIEKQKGYFNLPGSRYLGTPDRLLWRYKYNYSNRISASLIFEKDAGEFLIGGTKQKPFDYQSAHIGIYNSGKFKKIILGLSLIHI